MGVDTESKGYRIYWPGKHLVSIKRDVYFNGQEASEPDEVEIEGGNDLFINPKPSQPLNNPPTDDPLPAQPVQVPNEPENNSNKQYFSVSQEFRSEPIRTAQNLIRTTQNYSELLLFLKFILFIKLFILNYYYIYMYKYIYDYKYIYNYKYIYIYKLKNTYLAQTTVLLPSFGPRMY